MTSYDSAVQPNYTIDPDAVMWDRDPEERADKPLLVMMHGLGSHEGDLFGLNRFLPDDLVVASLRAPLGYGGGHAWFPAGSGYGDDTAPLDASVQAVLDWIDTLEVTPAGIGLMGFSQGGCMALQLIRQAPERFNYVLQLSGFVAHTDHPGDTALAARQPQMPVFWAHGDQDQVIAASAIEHTGQWLTGNTAVEAHRYPMGHSVSQPELADLVDFVTVQLQS